MRKDSTVVPRLTRGLVAVITGRRAKQRCAHFLWEKLHYVNAAAYGRHLLNDVILDFKHLQLFAS